MLNSRSFSFMTLAVGVGSRMSMKVRHYEYICKRAHVRVHYCVESFTNDDTLSSTLLKTLKRSMAAEYSRELSGKVYAGQLRLIELGYRQGGHPGYGLRRLLVDLREMRSAF